MRPFWELLVVSELNGRAHIDTSEGGGLDLPVLDRVAEETHSRVRSLLSVVARRAEVIGAHYGDVVVVQIDNLRHEAVQNG